MLIKPQNNKTPLLAGQKCLWVGLHRGIWTSDLSTSEILATVPLRYDIVHYKEHSFIAGIVVVNELINCSKKNGNQ